MAESNLFHPNGIMFELHASSKKQLFQEISSSLIDTYDLQDKGIASRDIVTAAMDRERLGSTGVGNGVALPHARVKGLENVVAVFAKLETPLDFESIDDRAVDLVAFLLAPEESGGAHLRALAKVSRLLRRQDVRARLRAAPSAEALYTIISEQQAASAA